MKLFIPKLKIMKPFNYKNVLKNIQKKESTFKISAESIIQQSNEMVIFLREVMKGLKTNVVTNGCNDDRSEIEFFKVIKPQVLGKLIYYNKVYRIEMSRPANNGKMYYNYYSLQLERLKLEYVEHICSSNFYRYYRSGRSDRDAIYFQRGNINYYDGHKSVVFEIDTNFSTFFDFKIAKIIANELFYSYLLTKISPDRSEEHTSE